MALGHFYWAPQYKRTQDGHVDGPVYCKGLLNMTNDMFPSRITLLDGSSDGNSTNTPSVCGVGWINLCKLMTQCKYHIQSEQASEAA